MNTLTRIYILVLLPFLSCCTSLKQHRISERSLLNAYTEQVELLNKDVRQLESLVWEQEVQGESIVWSADSLLHWHPDSGLYLQPAALQIKVIQHKLTENTKATKQTASSGETQSLAKRQTTQWKEEHLQKDVQGLKKSSYLWLLAALGFLLLLWFLRRFSQ